MAYNFKEMIAEDWKKEYEKVILSRKYAFASTMIGHCSANPNINNVKLAYGSIVDYITSIPVGNDVKGQEVRKDILIKLNEMKIVLYGNPDDIEVIRMLIKHAIGHKNVRRGVKIYTELSNVPDVVDLLRGILIDCGDFATMVGLRITLHKRKKIGMSGVMEREGLDDLDIDGSSDKDGDAKEGKK